MDAGEIQGIAGAGEEVARWGRRGAGLGGRGR